MIMEPVYEDGKITSVNLSAAPSTKTPKQLQAERKKKKEEEAKQKRRDNYWNAMISRKETVQLIREGIKDVVQQTVTNDAAAYKTLYLYQKSLVQALINKGIVTEEEINEASKELSL